MLRFPINTLVGRAITYIRLSYQTLLNYKSCSDVLGIVYIIKLTLTETNNCLSSKEELTIIIFHGLGIHKHLNIITNQIQCYLLLIGRR